MKECKAPRGEVPVVSYHKSNDEMVALITQKTSSDYYILYKTNPDGSLEKLGHSKSPTELERKYNIRKIMGNTDKHTI